MTAKSAISNILKIISAASIVVLCYIGVTYFGTDISLLLIMIAFMLFYVLLPGCLIIDASKLRSEHISTYLIRGFFAGFIFNILIYFITDLIGTDILMYSAGPVLSVIYIIKRIRTKENRGPGAAAVIKKLPASLFIFFALVFLYSFLTTQGTYIPPYMADFSEIKLDFGFHAGIINGLVRGFPAINPWVMGRTIYYHFFTEMLYSIPVRLFNVRAEELLLCCTPYIITPVFSCALYSFFREFVRDGRKCGLYCLSLLLSNMFILKSFPSSWFLYHLFSNINNAGMGIAGMLVILPLLKTWDNNVIRDSERGAMREVIFLAAMIMLTTGIKGPAAIVVVGGMTGTVILGLILRKLDLRTIPALIIAAASFTFIFVYVLGSNGIGSSGGKGGGSLLNPWEVTDIFFFKDNIMRMFPSRSVSLVVLLAAFVVISLTAFIVPFIFGYIRELFLVLSGRKEFIFSKVTVYATCMVGYLALLLLNYSGHSQVYFGFASLILVPVISFWYLEDLEKSKKSYASVIKTIFIICLCVTSITFAMDMVKLAGKAQNTYENRNGEHTLYRAVSALEYEGLMWLNENTDEDSLIASDRYYSVAPEKYDYTARSNNNHFAYAIYSERNQYLEGSGFSLGSDENDLRKEMIDNTNDMMDPANDARGDLARSLDVDYVVISKRFHNVGDLSSEDYTLVFSNDDMDIYEVEDEDDAA